MSQKSNKNMVYTFLKSVIELIYLVGEFMRHSHRDAELT